MDGPWVTPYETDNEGEILLDDDNNPIVDQDKLNRYQYNGKELTEDLGLNWNDYGARWYDPAIARWNAVDPLAEKQVAYSPFNYVFGNPTRFKDPTGLIGEDATSNIPIRFTGDAAKSFYQYLTQAMKNSGEGSNNKNDPPESLVSAYSKALEALADARAEDIIGLFDQYSESYGSFRVSENVSGFKFDGRIIGNNEYSYKNVTLNIDGQEVTVDEIIFLAGPQEFNVVTGVKDYVANIAGTMSGIEGPVYQVMGRLGSKRIKLQTGYEIPSDGLGRVNKGFIIARGQNHTNVEKVLYKRTERQVIEHINKRYSNGGQRSKLLNWLYDRQALKRPRP